MITIKESELKEKTRITSGGQSIISKALWKERYVAIKEGNHGTDDIRDEIELVRSKNIRHSNIVDYLACSSPSFIVLELMKYDLEYIILDDSKYTDLKNNALRCILNIMSGLKYLHENDVLHMDLNPKNVLVTINNNLLDFKICDLGYAMCKSKISTIDRSKIIGRPSYIAPEKIEDTENIVPENFDIWSLGSLIWKLLTRTDPYSYPHELTIYYQIGKKNHPDVPKDWPVAMQKLFFMCWDKRKLTHHLLDLFQFSSQKNEIKEELKKEMPLKFNCQYVISCEKRKLSANLWNSRSKFEVFNRFNKNFVLELKNYCGCKISSRKLESINSVSDLLRVLNEYGIINNRDDFNNIYKDIFEFKRILKLYLDSNTWQKIARSFGISDELIDELKNCNCKETIISELMHVLEKRDLISLDDLVKILEDLLSD